MVEGFDSVMKLRVGEFQKRAYLSKFSIHVVTVFGMPAVQVHLKRLGYRLDVTAKTFDQDSGVPLGLFSGGGDLLAESSGRGGELVPEGGGHSFLGFAYGGELLAEGSGRGGELLAESSGCGGELVPEGGGHSFLGFAYGGELLAESSGRGGELVPEGGGHSFLGFAQGSDVLAEALGGRRHDPFNLGKRFGIHGRPPCDGREV